MYDEDFAKMFFEFLHEYSNDPEILNTLKPFIEYGWGVMEVNGVQTEESEDKQRDFIAWMVDNGASIKAIESAIKLMRL